MTHDSHCAGTQSAQSTISLATAAAQKTCSPSSRATAAVIISGRDCGLLCSTCSSFSGILDHRDQSPFRSGSCRLHTPSGGHHRSKFFAPAISLLPIRAWSAADGETRARPSQGRARGFGFVRSGVRASRRCIRREGCLRPARRFLPRSLAGAFGLRPFLIFPALPREARQGCRGPAVSSQSLLLRRPPALFRWVHPITGPFANVQKSFAKSANERDRSRCTRQVRRSPRARISRPGRHAAGAPAPGPTLRPRRRRRRFGRCATGRPSRSTRPSTSRCARPMRRRSGISH